MCMLIDMLKDVTKNIAHDEFVTRQLDLHIGNLIKRLRTKEKINQSTLSTGAGVSLAQIRKYEEATNRVSASRLYWIARVLRTSPNYFFDSFLLQNNAKTGLSDNTQDTFLSEDMEQKEYEREKKELLEAYFSIADPEKRKWHLQHIQQDCKSE